MVQEYSIALETSRVWFDSSIVRDFDGSIVRGFDSLIVQWFMTSIVGVRDFESMVRDFDGLRGFECSRVQ